MKKVSLTLLSLLCLVSFAVCVYAEGLTDQLDSKVKQVEGTVDNAGKLISNPVVARDELRKAYLKQAWGQILESKPVIGDIIRGYRKISPYSDPVFEYVIGMVPTFSWYFLLLFFIWFTLIRYYSVLIEFVKEISIFNNTSSVVISLAFFCILTILQVFQTISKWISDKVVSLFSFFSPGYVQLIALVILVFGLIILGRFSKQIKILLRINRLKRMKAKKEKDQDEAIKQLKKTAEIVKESTSIPLGLNRGEGLAVISKKEDGFELIRDGKMLGFFKNKKDADNAQFDANVGYRERKKSRESSSTASMSRARSREESGEAEYERSTADEL
jgi:hypothetical protein